MIEKLNSASPGLSGMWAANAKPKPWRNSGRRSARWSIRLGQQRTGADIVRGGTVVGRLGVAPDALGSAMPFARHDREKALPDAWWRNRIWRTQGGSEKRLVAPDCVGPCQHEYDLKSNIQVSVNV